jgi:hypothetical protein
MDDLARDELELRFKEALREHQHEGLHMVGGADQLVARLLRVVEEWERGAPLRGQKSA